MQLFDVVFFFKGSLLFYLLKMYSFVVVAIPEWLAYYGTILRSCARIHESG